MTRAAARRVSYGTSCVAKNESRSALPGKLGGVLIRGMGVLSWGPPCPKITEVCALKTACADYWVGYPMATLAERRLLRAFLRPQLAAPQPRADYSHQLGASSF